MDKNMIRSNIVSEKEIKEMIEVVLTTVSTSLAKSLGPYGSTTIVQSSEGHHVMTKDGFNILSTLRFNDSVLQTILSIIQDISTQLVMKVGDGSTTSIVAARYFYEELSHLDLKELRPREVIDRLNNIITALIDKLTNYATPVSADMSEVKHLAAISVNNDESIGELIHEIYSIIGKNGFINIQLGNTTKTYFTRSEGFQIPFGYLDEILVNTDTSECILANPKVIMFDGALNDETYHPHINYLLDLTEQRNETLVIIAPGYGAAVSDFFRSIITYFGRAGRRPKINVISHPMGNEHFTNSFYDLATKLGATVIKNSLGDKIEIEKIPEFLGSCEKVVSSYKLTSFFGGAGKKEDVDIRISNIRNELRMIKESGIKNASKEYELEKRLAVLEDLLCTIYVGGNSEQARMSDKHLIEDAVAACRSAIDNGFVIGGNLSISIQIEELSKSSQYDEYDRLLLLAIKNAFYKVFATILNNKYDREDIDNTNAQEIYNECVDNEIGYNLISDTFDVDKHIINSVETEIEVLKNVTSIMGLLLLSNQFITVNAQYDI